MGAITPLNLRFFGLWRDIPRETFVRVLSPVAACGLALAAVAGLLLFMTRATEYASNPVFLAKLIFVSAGALSAIALHLSQGRYLLKAADSTLFRHALLSISCWICALTLGRLIAFTGN